MTNPVGWSWNAGRPKWKASPRLRRAGWPSVIRLQERAGVYLKRGPSKAMARRINADVERWENREPCVEFGLSVAPKARQVTHSQAGVRTLRAAYDAWTAHPVWRSKAEKTRASYAQDLRRVLKFAGGETVAFLDRPTLVEWAELERDKVFARRHMGWDDALWEAARTSQTQGGTRYNPELRAQRVEHEDENLISTPGLRQVNNCLIAVGALYSFITDELKWMTADAHPARNMGRAGLVKPTRPRLRLPSDEEAAALIEGADALGLPSVGDILVALGHAGQRPSDLINLTEAQYTPETRPDGVPSGRFRLSPQKTSKRMGGQLVDFRASAILARRMARALNHRAEVIAPMVAAHVNSVPPNIFLRDDTGQPFTLDRFEKLFAKIREAVSEGRPASQTPTGTPIAAVPSVHDIIAYDFRRLAITRLSASGSTTQRIAAITGHSLKTVDTILKHYSVSTAEIADKAIDQLDEHLARKGVRY